MKNGIGNLSGCFLVTMTVFAVATAVPSTVFAWSHNEHNVNTTGQTAHDIVKILDGKYDVSDMMTWDFSVTNSYHRVVNGKDQTVLRWTPANASENVPANAVGDACFTAVPTPGSGSAPYARIIGAWWTDASGAPIGAFPTPGMSMEVDFPGNGEPGVGVVPVIRIGNRQQVIEAGNPDFVLVPGVQAPALHVNGPVRIAIVDGAVGPRDLWFQETLRDRPDLQAQGVKALQPDSFFDVFFEINHAGGAPLELNPGEMLEGFFRDPATGGAFAVPEILPGQSLVAIADLGGGNFDTFSFQYVPEPGSLVLLSAGSLVVLARRRR